MFYKNLKSKRENPFRKIYDNQKFIDVLKSRSQPAKFPFLVDVELTNHCNLSCLFCGQQTMTREKGFMTVKVFKKVADECARYKAPIRLIRWGEPTLHPKFLDFIKYAKKRNLLVHMTTNGLLLNKQKIKKLIKASLDSLVFSFQGATKTEYQIMRDNNKYDLLKKNILDFVKLRGEKKKPYLHISCTVTNEPKKQMNNFIKYWGNIADSVGVGKTNLSRFNLVQIKKFKNIGKLKELKKQETIKKVYKPCKEVYQKFSIDWDGKVSACCGDYDQYLTVGDVNKQTLEEVWNKSEKLKAIRTLLDKGCFRCLTLCSTCFHTYEEF